MATRSARNWRSPWRSARLGKHVRVINRDPVPAPYRDFPGIDTIEFAHRADGPADAVVLLECSDITRPGLDGLDRSFVVNVDHHLGNGMYGAVNWFDAGAAACAEMVADIIDALGVPWTPEIASHLYLGIATDTGGFRHGPISARTFETCRRIALTGVEPAALSRRIFDSFGIGRVKLTGAMLNQMELLHHGRLALLTFDDALLDACGATIDDTEGLVNVPLGAREVAAVALFKRQADGSVRVSLRSKGNVDVRSVALLWNGGGHTNAAGCTLTGDVDAGRGRDGRRPDPRDRPMTPGSPRDGRRSPHRQADRPHVARRRRAAAQRHRRAQHRPHRHARSARERPAPARPRPGHAALRAPHRRRQDLRGDRCASDSRPTPTTRWASRSGRRSPTCRTTRRLPAALVRFRGTFDTGSADPLGQEGRRAARPTTWRARTRRWRSSP